MQSGNNPGTTYYLRKRVKKSIRYRRCAIKFNPLSCPYHVSLRAAYFTRKSYKKTFEEFRIGIKLDPEVSQQSPRHRSEFEAHRASAGFHSYICKDYESLGDADKAGQTLKRAMENGFGNWNQILHDPDMRKISKGPALTALIKNPPVGIKK